ncbi:T-cell-specific surface glycoprotein CD28 isoform X1 [Paralichthys olivaceus]|uniref:T-cell-specific surface glycoprotein CD28 isoform X1 n=1 Tax=Paralichthys olivaceus TaxID=8255 RepID=UPI003752A125
MSVSWMFLLLLGCRSSCTTHVSQSTCPCNVQLKTVCVANREDVHVPCPIKTEDEMTFNLFKGQELISNVSCTGENHTLNCTVLNARVGVEVERKQQKSVDFVLTGVNESSHGTYRCEGIITFPPPFKGVPSVVMIQVLVEGHLCKCNKESSNHGDNSSQIYKWIWILMVVLLSIYSITVTIIAIVNWVRMRNIDSQSDYMNTKPRGQRDGRKKRGVQKPIPRHF